MSSSRSSNSSGSSPVVGVDHALINKLMVNIASCKIQLTKCETMEEMDQVCENINRLEAMVAVERRKDIDELLKRKDDILRQISDLEHSLDDINREMNAKLNKFRNSVSSKLNMLELCTKSEMEYPTIDENESAEQNSTDDETRETHEDPKVEQDDQPVEQDDQPVEQDGQPVGTTIANDIINSVLN